MLRVYQNTPNNVIVYWSFYPYSKSLILVKDLLWDLEIDITPDFNSNIKETITFDNDPQNGYIIDPDSQIVRGIKINIEDSDILKRAFYSGEELFFRIKTNLGVFSYVSPTKKYKLLNDKTFELKNEIYGAIPETIISPPNIEYIDDTNSYQYQDSKNIHKLFNCFVKELNNCSFELQKINYFFNPDYMSDEFIKIWGNIFKIPKLEISSLDFREIVINFFYASKFSGTLKALEIFIKSIYRYPYLFKEMKNMGFVYCSDLNTSNWYLVNENNIDNSEMSNYYFIDENSYINGFELVIKNPLIQPQKINFEIMKNLCRKLIPSHFKVKIIEEYI